MNNFTCPVCDKSIETGVGCITHGNNVYHTTCYDIAYLPLATDTNEEVRAKEVASKLVARGIDRDILRTLLEAAECTVLQELNTTLADGKHHWVTIESDGQQWYVTGKVTKDNITKSMLEAHNEGFTVKRVWYKGIRHNAELQQQFVLSKAV